VSYTTTGWVSCVVCILCGIVCMLPFPFSIFGFILGGIGGHLCAKAIGMAWRAGRNGEL